MLELKQIRFNYPQVRIEADFSIKRGSCVALMGASGCGKSTLINMIAGFVQPLSGEIRFDGKLLNKLKPAARPLTVLFQSGNLFQHFTVWQNVAVGLEPGLKLTPQQRQQVSTALAAVNLANFETRKPGSLSGGQQQRVALARCLARNRPLLLLDEPFSALDHALVQEMLSIVQSLQRENKLTVLLATHQQEDAEQVADLILTMENSKVHQLPDSE